MNIKELKEIIKDLPDTLEIYITEWRGAAGESGYEVDREVDNIGESNTITYSIQSQHLILDKKGSAKVIMQGGRVAFQKRILKIT